MLANRGFEPDGAWSDVDCLAKSGLVLKRSAGSNASRFDAKTKRCSMTRRPSFRNVVIAWLGGHPRGEATQADRFSLEPWKFAKNASVTERAEQRHFHASLRRSGDITLDKTSYVSRDSVLVGQIKIGARTSVGGGVQVGIKVEIGNNCTLNPFSVVRGNVVIGNDTRVATGAQILGFNHNSDRLDVPIWKQGLSYDGIEIGEDCWIGANAVVLDGVRIGAHAIVAAGAVVTKDVSEFTIVAGNPARPIKSRKYGRFVDRDNRDFGWRGFSRAVCEQMPAILARSLSKDGMLDYPGAKPTTRALADATELAAMADCAVPGFSGVELIETLQSWQDPTTGLVPGPFNEEGFVADSERAVDLEFRSASYAAMSTGYALETLGARLKYPIAVVQDFSSERLVQKLSSLPWGEKAWQCGAWIDHFATACYFNERHHGLVRDLADLRRWLEDNVDSASALWGHDFPKGDFLQPTNGFYRLTRGAHAQYGWAVERPERVIDTVLAHAHDPRHLSDESATACNVLDIIHPLYFCGKQTDYRKKEIEAVARFWLQKTIAHWGADEGMCFGLKDSKPPRLQGTEMWLSIGWLCAYMLGLTNSGDGFRPKGIHRI